MDSRHAGFITCGTWTYLLHSLWDLPGLGIELVSPALSGGLNHQGSLITGTFKSLSMTMEEATILKFPIIFQDIAFLPEI